MVGATLLHYRILRPLGAGGMGEVYAADDTRLHRQVALKILPASTAADPEALARIRREAQAIAALNHPNVVTIYAVEEADGTPFITMELVDGETLSSRIRPGGLPLREILEVAVPLADAVAAAHAQGVVHRDLKPGNVMVTPGGRVKVLDFGLAKLRPRTAAGDMNSTTRATLSRADQVVGTPAYMSPEQAEGRAVDARTDIFSLGVLLYEMAAGTRPFGGETPMAVISSVLKDTPAPIAQGRPDLPSDLDRIVRRSLAKDPTKRYQSALDLRNDLEELHQTLTTPVATAAGEGAGRGAVRWSIASAVLGTVALAVYFTWNGTRTSSDASEPPALGAFTQLTSTPAAELYPSLSPDGRWVVYSGEGEGNRDVYLQSTTGQTAINLTKESTEDDEQPAFSPDGEWIAFRSARDGGGIFVMGRTGEAVRRLTRNGFNPAWSPDGSEIAYTTRRMELRPQNSDGRSELWAVRTDGRSEPRKVFDGDATLPSWSPHGTRIAFGQRLGVDQNISVMSVPAGGGAPTPLLSSSEMAWNPVWSPDGRFVYLASDRGGSMNLWRVGVDEDSGERRGEPQPITTPAPFAAHLSVAADGRRLAYSSVAETQNIQRLPFDPITASRRVRPSMSPRDRADGRRPIRRLTARGSRSTRRCSPRAISS